MKKYGINFSIGEKAYKAFLAEADKKQFFVTGLFRQFLIDIAEKYDCKRTGIRPPSLRETQPDRNGKKLSCQLGIMFANPEPVDMVEALVKKEKEASPKIDKTKFLRKELMLWLNEQGYDLKPEDMHFSKPQTKKAAA